MPSTFNLKRGDRQRNLSHNPLNAVLELALYSKNCKWKSKNGKT